MPLVDVLTPQYWSSLTLAQLFKRSTMLQLVNRDYDSTIAERGDTINLKRPGLASMQDAGGVFNSVEMPAEKVSVVLDKWRETVPWSIDDKTISLAQNSPEELIRIAIIPQAEAIVAELEAAITARYVDFYTAIGAPGTTPADVAALVSSPRKRFDDSNIPSAGRRVVLNTAASAKYIEQFWKANETGSTDTQIEGALGRKGGADYYDSTYLGTHTQGGWSTAPLVNNGPGYAAGVKQMNVDALGSGTLNLGDIFRINHGGAIGVREYVLTISSTITTNAATINFEPGLAASVADNAAITVVASHAINLGLHRDAITLVSRPLAQPIIESAKGNVSVQEYMGIGIRTTIWNEPKDSKTYVKSDLLYGVKTLDARMGFRIMG